MSDSEDKTCKSCAMWSCWEMDGSGHGWCDAVAFNEDIPDDTFAIVGIDIDEEDAYLETGPDFGCVRWKEKIGEESEDYSERNESHPGHPSEYGDS